MVTTFTRRALSVRREKKRLEAAGYRRHETDWEIHRGASFGKVITDAVISADGLYVYTKIGARQS